MASVILVGNRGYTDIEYCLHDGRVRCFTERGQVVYDEQAAAPMPNWQERLVRCVKRAGLDDPTNPALCEGGVFRGFHSFIFWMAERGLLHLGSTEGAASA